MSESSSGAGASSNSGTSEDPRWRNRVFRADSVAGYLKHYADALHASLAAVDPEALQKGFGLLKSVMETGGHVYVAGNGGSAAISSHLCCDWMKGTFSPGQPRVRVNSLSSDISVITAFGNDYGYPLVFSKQVEMLCKKGDLLVLISSSGNSENILNAARTAREQGLKTLAMTGFSGGKVRDLVDVTIHVAYENYGIVEDAHQAVMHVFAQYLAQSRG